MGWRREEERGNAWIEPICVEDLDLLTLGGAGRGDELIGAADLDR